MDCVFAPFHRGGSGSPLVCLHGFMDTWRTWELVPEELERHHEVLAPTLLGHAGGPPLEGAFSDPLIPDAIARAMDDAGFQTAHMAGNSLGGYVALQLAARGRAQSVVAFAPAGGWAKGDQSFKETLGFQAKMHDQMKAAAPHADTLMASAEGRRRAARLITTNFEHIPAELLAHLTVGGACCKGARPMIEYAIREGYRPLEAEHIACPVRIVWGTADKLLPWPSTAAGFRNDWLPHADWVELEGVGHCPQIDIPLEAAQLIVGFTARAPMTIGRPSRDSRGSRAAVRPVSPGRPLVPRAKADVARSRGAPSASERSTVSREAPAPKRDAGVIVRWRALALARWEPRDRLHTRGDFARSSCEDVTRR